MRGVEAVAIEIGLAGYLTATNAMAAAGVTLLAMRRCPFAEISLVIGGYEDDPREIWEIPEAKDYVEMFVAAMFALKCPPVSAWRLNETTVGVVAMCCDIGKIVDRDPVTRAYRIEINNLNDPRGGHGR